MCYFLLQFILGNTLTFFFLKTALFGLVSKHFTVKSTPVVFGACDKYNLILFDFAWLGQGCIGRIEFEKSNQIKLYLYSKFQICNVLHRKKRRNKYFILCCCLQHNKHKRIKKQNNSKAPLHAD